jgi:predicted ATPase
MIKSAEISNFRCYKRANLKDCQRVNLIVGRNGSGKTALLEALFLGAGGSAEIAFRLKQLRGYEGTISGPQEEVGDALWRDLFYQFNKKQHVRIALLGSEHRNRTLEINFSEPSEAATVIRTKDRDESGETEQLPIVFKWIGPGTRRATIKPRLKDGRVILSSVSALPEETFFFSAIHNYSSSETARRFSDLSRSFRDDEVKKIFFQYFPEMSDISIEIIGGSPMVSGKYEGISEKLPLNLASSGMTKMASILFALAHKKGGILLIDELENGIYYQLFPKLWASLLAIAKSNDAQIFVTSHSSECIRAAAAVAKENPGDFTLIETDHGSIREIDGASFSEAIRQNIEVR